MRISTFATYSRFHIDVHFLEISRQGGVGVTPGYRPEFEHRLVGERPGQSVVVQAGKFVELLAGKMGDGA